MRYLVLTSEKHEQIFCTKNILETFSFVTRYHDAKIRVMDHNARPKLVSQLNYLKEFKRLSGSLDKFFQLCDIMITGRTNKAKFLSDLGLNKMYKTYQEVNAKIG